jgi:replicative DNA helicase
MINYEAELLSRILFKPDVFWEVADLISEHDFIDTINVKIFKAIKQQLNSELPVDAVTLADVIKAEGETFSYLINLQKNSYTASGATHYAEQLKQQTERNKVNLILAQAQSNLADTNPQEVAGQLISELENISVLSKTEYAYQGIVSAGLDAIEESLARSENGGLVGAPTGFPILDKSLGGLWGPKLVVIAARPAIGKTAMMLQMAIAGAKAGTPVGIMSLEMDAPELAIRIMAHRTGVNMSAVSFGYKEEIDSILYRQKSLKALPIWLEDGLYSLDQIVARAVQWRAKHKIGVLFVDYLGLITSKGRNRLEQMTEITRTFKLLSKRLSIPVVALAQLNRSSEQGEREPRLSDMRDSGTVEQDANIVLALHKDDSDEGMLPMINIGVLKNRGGKTGWIKNRYAFDGSTQRFKHIDKQN